MALTAKGLEIKRPLLEREYDVVNSARMFEDATMFTGVSLFIFSLPWIGLAVALWFRG